MLGLIIRIRHIVFSTNGAHYVSLGHRPRNHPPHTPPALKGRFKTMPQSLARLCVHLVFSTKHREPLLQDSIRNDLHAYMATVLKNMDCPALIINSVENHIHILLDLGRTVSTSYVMEHVKKTSSKWIKTQSPALSHFAWQAGYGAFAVSESNVPAVRQYIQNQREHHQKVNFQEEYRSFLTKHQISYDERYVWD